MLDGDPRRALQRWAGGGAGRGLPAGGGLRRWSWRSQPGRVVWRVFCGVLAAGAVLFGTVEGLLLFRGQQDNRALPSDAVIVLGAGVNGTEPSLILQSRIDAAADYLERHPDVLAVLSGGRGPGEEITEAKAMAQGLTQRGIPASRLILEEASTSMAENFAGPGNCWRDGAWTRRQPPSPWSPVTSTASGPI